MRVIECKDLEGNLISISSSEIAYVREDPQIMLSSGEKSVGTAIVLCGGFHRIFVADKYEDVLKALTE